MTYSPEAIDAVIGRVGWATPTPPYPLVLESRNTDSASGRYFNAFHKLASVETAVDVMPNSQADSEGKNQYLYELREAAARTVLTVVFNTNVRANLSASPCSGGLVDNTTKDYSQLILAKSPVLDQCLGYQLAVDVLNLCLGSSRTNINERAAKYNKNEIMFELKGAMQNGEQTYKGLEAKLEDAYRNAIDILFPQEPYKQKPKLRNRSIW